MADFNDNGLAQVPSNVPADRVVDFDIFNPPGIEEMSVHDTWLNLQRSTSHKLVWTPRNEGHWIALSGKMVRMMYRDPGRFSSNVIFVPKSQGEKYGLLPTRLDPPDHSPFRAVLLNAIGMTATQKAEPMIRKIARSLVAEIAPRGACNFTDDFALIFPVRVFMGLCNQPPEDAVKNKIWIDQLVRADGSMSMEEVMARCYAYVDPIIDNRLQSSEDDLISRVIKSDVDGRQMSRDEMRSIIGLLIAGGGDTVVSQLGFFMEFIAKNPTYRQQLVKEPKLIRKAVEELLRLLPIIIDGRIAKVETELDGVIINEGDMVSLPTLFGGLDAEANKCPMEADFNRKGTSHMTFGEGPHICAGQHLARLQLMITIEEWLKLIPDFEVPSDVKVRHRAGTIFQVENLPLQWTPTAISA